MPRFRIAISPGVTHIVDAATLADARKNKKEQSNDESTQGRS